MCLYFARVISVILSCVVTNSAHHYFRTPSHSLFMIALQLSNLEDIILVSDAIMCSLPVAFTLCKKSPPVPSPSLTFFGSDVPRSIHLLL